MLYNFPRTTMICNPRPTRDRICNPKQLSSHEHAASGNQRPGMPRILHIKSENVFSSPFTNLIHYRASLPYNTVSESFKNTFSLASSHLLRRRRTEEFLKLSFDTFPVILFIKAFGRQLVGSKNSLYPSLPEKGDGWRP